ncbi:MAG TPA: DNA topoisomerase, partial [Candidatus Omnitrophota bacterium]|nr:DNA topoisomerase [Candidatus Omnitrophota bacterium]
MPGKTKTKKAKQDKKSLVIVESPSKAKTINKFLGRDFYVEASMGHVRDLPRSKLGVNLESNFEPHYVIPTKSKKTVTKLKKMAKKMGSIFLAPDPDREGEAISWHLAAIFQSEEHPIKRVVFNEITRDAVRKAFEKPRDIDLNLVNAQQARRVMDRIVGYLLSPLLWKKVRSGLSAGRVQSVALRLISEKENEIRAFKPEEYWTIEAALSSKREGVRESKFLAKLDKIRNEKAKISNAAEAQALKEILEKEIFHVADVEEKERRRKPLAPFTTSKMQQDA